ncbi:helix-turn-helix domain-containing protein, partial [Ligilactobacillus saerimneri]|uniref:helix-turn-helix domain-containing protein n=1 Tax=Ligilactobacillus saerimneri TaxID=228229 RepID=UPI003F257A92
MGDCKMNTWDDLFKNQTALTKEEVYIIDSLSSLVVQRMKRGITQAELAKQMGMSQSQLARLEN